MSVRTQGFPDMTSPAVLRPQLDRLEPGDVGPVEEHKPDDGRPLVDLERVTGKNRTLDDHPARIDGEK